MITPAFSLTATERVLPRLALDFTTANLDARVSVTRALDTATRFNSNGFIETVNANLPRFDYTLNSGGACNGLLIEESRINILQYSTTMAGASWLPNATGTGVAPIVTTNAGISPDGTNNATKLEFNAPAASDISGYTQTAFTTAAGTYTGSLYIKAFSTSDVGKIIGFRHVASGASTLITLTSTWTRVERTEVRFTSEFQLVLRPAIGTSSGVVSVLVYGGQLEVGAFATSYIPNTGTGTTTRNFDAVSMTGTNFSDWYNASNGAFVAWFDTVRPAGVGYIYSANAAGSIGNSIYQSVFANTTDNYVLSGGVQQARLLSGTITANTQAKTGLRYANADFATAANGGALQTQLSGSLPVGVDRLNIGQSAGGGNFLNGHAAKLFWYASLTNAELVAFTK